MSVDKLPEEINEMKIRDDKVEKVAFLRFGENSSFVYLPFTSILYFKIFCFIGNGRDSGGWKWDRNRPHHCDDHWW